MPPTPANFQPDLIFDVGASNGDDSAYYLHKGFRVVAVEANPLAAAALEERFAKEIAAGRLSLVATAISDVTGDVPFWVCDDIPGWSSFDPTIAGYLGKRHHRITVSAIPFSSLLERFGVPFYCKIDIEGSDRLCIEQMSVGAAPPFVSLELPTTGSEPVRAETEAIMNRLERLGYERFKVISQVTFRQPGPFLPAVKAALPAALSRRITQADCALRRYGGNGGWRFGEDSSGPFAENTRGEWLGAAQARRLIGIVQRNRDISDWYDVHAAVAPFD